ncbi:MAG: hypothetical protein ABMA00_14235 [Gemmatimonas sp.]
MRRIRADVLVALLLLSAHTLAVWGHVGVFWGDIGRWSHEVERFAHGELPYRDFQWHYPPLGLWIEGGVARLLGTDLAQLSTITTTLAALLIVTFVCYTREVLERADARVVAICVALTFSYAQVMGAPLPLGLYSPATLVGALCIANAARLFVKSLSSNARRDALWMALFAALAVLSKQDFWIPAAFLVGASTLRSRTLGPAAVSATITALGVTVIIWTAGADVLLPLLGGFGHARQAGGQGFPSWERLTVDVFALALVSGTFLFLCSVVGGKRFLLPLGAAGIVALLTGGLHVYFSMRTTLPLPGELRTPTQNALAYHINAGTSLLRPSIGWLAKRVSRTPIPVALPPLLLLFTALRWRTLPHPRRTVIALLLGLAISVRARRAFEGTEWFEFLLTVPVVLASAELLLNLTEIQRRRLRRLTCGTLAFFAGWSYVALGRGWGTGRHYPAFETLRGTVHWKPAEDGDYRNLLATLHAIDSTRQRPLFAFGYSGGFNYFLRRHNPFPFTQDFFLSAFNADSVLQQRPRGLILIDHRFLDDGSFGAPAFNWRRWEQGRVPAPYAAYDRPRFDRLREGCPAVATKSAMFRVYACP